MCPIESALAGTDVAIPASFEAGYKYHKLVRYTFSEAEADLSFIQLTGSARIYFLPSESLFPSQSD